MTTKENKRIYIVEAKTGHVHLVKASNQAQALRHVAKSDYQITIAKAVDVASMMAGGKQVEDASDEGSAE